MACIGVAATPTSGARLLDAASTARRKRHVQMQEQNFFHIVSTTRSMRRLDTRPVPMEIIRTIIDAGTRAASGQNTQPWHFVVISETEGKSKLGGWYQEVFSEEFSAQLPAADDHSALARDLRDAQYLAEHLREAPVPMLVCGLRDWPFDMKGERRVGPAPPSCDSVYPCGQNILLTCRAQRSLPRTGDSSRGFTPSSGSRTSTASWR